MGAVANFGTQGISHPFSSESTHCLSSATGFEKLFPGIKPHLLTLANNFKIPLHRDLILSLGICDVSSKSCKHILSSGPGASITIVIGGAGEALQARPGTNDLILEKQLGFVKMAMREGADLVPVFSFGENDIFEQAGNEVGTILFSLQKRCQAIFGFTLR